MSDCRVCHKPVTPWKGARRPHTTIHRHCLWSTCLFCGGTFKVKKERKGLYCHNSHQWLAKSFGTAENMARLDAR